MGILISNATSSAITKYSVSLRSGEPDWSMIPSTGKSNKSQAEFVSEIKELAQRAANTTSKTFTGREQGYVQNTYPMYPLTERHYISRLKMR